MISDQRCQGQFSHWSRFAAVSTHVFMPIITKNALKSEGMEWEFEEIDKKLCSPKKDFWKNAIVPICENIEVFCEYKRKLSPTAQEEIKDLSAEFLSVDNNYF